MLTLEKVVLGLGSAGASCYKDIYKAASKCMTDRSMTVRFPAAKVSPLALNKFWWCKHIPPEMFSFMDRVPVSLYLKKNGSMGKFFFKV